MLNLTKKKPIQTKKLIIIISISDEKNNNQFLLIIYCFIYRERPNVRLIRLTVMA